jgi:electron transport complex protein RnfG
VSLYKRMVIVLTSIGIVSGALLMSVNLLTKERITANKQREIEQAVIRVIPGTTTSQKIYEEKDFTVYEGKNDQGQDLGLAILTTAAGFQDKILYIFGLNLPLTRINSLYVLDQKETPGLGARVADEKTFLQFWEGRDSTAPLSLRKPAVEKEKLAPSEVNTVTGATVSSKAVLASVNAALDKIKKLKEEGKINIEEGHAE